MTHDEEEYHALDVDGLRLAVARELGYDIVYPFQGKFGPFFVDGVTSTGRENFTQIPEFSSDIAAAWGLVEEMRNTRVISMEFGDPFVVRVCFDRFPATTEIQAEGPTAPIAICRAWLMWKAGR